MELLIVISKNPFSINKPLETLPAIVTFEHCTVEDTSQTIPISLFLINEYLINAVSV